MTRSPHTNICFDCQNSAGGCSWSALDPDTLKPMFEPVEGWTATPVILNHGLYDGVRRYAHTYHITACPQFKPDEPKPHCGRRGT